MPFTPFHLGPALAIGFPLRELIHAPTFTVANVILDIEPFLVLLLGLGYPLHGFTHTFFLAFLVGLGLGYMSYLFEGFLSPLYRVILLESSKKLKMRSFLIAGFLGAMLHVLFDSPLYDDIHPFYPLTINPLYDPSLTLYTYLACVWMGIFAIIYYILSVALKAYRRHVSR